MDSRPIRVYSWQLVRIRLSTEDGQQPRGESDAVSIFDKEMHWSKLPKDVSSHECLICQWHHIWEGGAGGAPPRNKLPRKIP